MVLDSMYETMSISTGFYPNLDLWNANKVNYITSNPPVAFMACTGANLPPCTFYVHCIWQYIHFVTNSLFTVYKVNNVCKHINQFTSHLYKTNISVIIVTYRFLTMVVHV